MIAGANELGQNDAIGEADALELEDESLVDTAARTALEVLDGTETGYADTATAWHRLAKCLDIGGRNRALTVSAPALAKSPAVLDDTARTRIEQMMQRLASSGEIAERFGVLYAADFEKQTARLRASDGAAIEVRFGEAYAGSIKQALREETHLRGRITYNERTSAIVDVDYIEVSQSDQPTLDLPALDRWGMQSVRELAEQEAETPLTVALNLRDEAVNPDDESFRRLIESGELRGGTGDSRALLDTPPLQLPFSLMDALDAEREERV